MEAQEILDAFLELPDHRKHEAMRMACSYALEVWERYAGGGSIEYTDSVVGMHHVVDMQLPMRAIEAVDRRLVGLPVEPDPIWNAYQEPRAAMQDGDLDFPDAIASAYNAIYNLFGVVFGRLVLYDDETVVRQAATGPGFYEEWWTRTWDAWASRPDVRYPPSELDATTFAALERGDLAAALAACAPDTRLHAVLLALAGQTDEAIRVAARVLGTEPDAWLRDHVLAVGATDAIAVGAGHYAAIAGTRYVVRRIGDNALWLAGRYGFDLRRVALDSGVLLAGDASDRIGTYATAVAGERGAYKPSARTELLGTRQVVALGSDGAIVAASQREIGVLTADGYERLGDGAVAGAAFDADASHVVTYAGTSYGVWRRADGRRLLVEDTGADIWHAMLAGGRVLIACEDGRARRRAVV